VLISLHGQRSKINIRSQGGLNLTILGSSIGEQCGVCVQWGGAAGLGAGWEARGPNQLSPGGFSGAGARMGWREKGPAADAF